MSVAHFLDTAPWQEIVERIDILSRERSPQAIVELQAMLGYRAGDTFSSHVIPRLVCRALLQHGSAGVVALTDALPTAPGATYPMTIIEALWLASEGRLAPVMTLADIETKITDPPSNETAKAADAAVRDLVAASTLRACGPLVLAVPPVVQPDGPVAPRGAGDQVELVGLGVVVEQPGALARHVGKQVQVELVDQVEPHE